VSGGDGELITAWHTAQSLKGFSPSLDFPLVVREGKLVSQMPIDDRIELESDCPRSVACLEQEPKVAFDDGGGSRHDLLEATVEVGIGHEGSPIGKVG
jgi:hypothetical protein